MSKSHYQNTNIDITNTAKRLYNKKSADFLFREIVSNAMHSCIISKVAEPNIKIHIKELNIKELVMGYNIIISDNGIGFDDENYGNFTVLNKENEIKRQHGFQSFGQGRLSLVYYADNSKYESRYKKDNKIWERSFNYPSEIDSLLCSDSNNICDISDKTIGTFVEINITSKDKAPKIKSFFDKYDTISKLSNWFRFTFFPLMQKVSISIEYKGESNFLSLETISDNQKDEFKIKIEEEEYTFTLYSIDTESSKHIIYCFAKGVFCEFAHKTKLHYELKTNKLFYLTSDYFDATVDTVGEKIECDEEIFQLIQNEINTILNAKFSLLIKENKGKTENNFKAFNKNRPSFGLFINKDNIANSSINEISERDMQKIASEKKISAEVAYWNDDETEYEEAVIQSGLFTYFKHREKILKQFQTDFLEHYNKDGDKKSENENLIHNILFPRSNEVIENDSIKKYFTHNLWLIDDKFSLFHSAESITNGKGASDIYLYCDNDNATEMVIIELKSTHKAHNSGTIIEQINNYAIKIYNQDNKVLKGKVKNTQNCRYSAFIIASKEDIDKEYESAVNKGAGIDKIPFLENSYYSNSNFMVDKKKYPIRIELISYKDLYHLANSRNEPIIKLMRNEA